MLAFLVFQLGGMKAMALLVTTVPMLLLGRLGLLGADAGKQWLLRRSFKGRSAEDCGTWGRRFCEELMPRLVRPAALDRLRWHQQQGHRVIVVTASCGLWVRDWCTTEGLELIATELEVKDGLLTGAMATPNCKGIEKIERLRAVLDLERTERIHAYGDTPADRPMLSLASDPHYKPFR